MRAMIQTEKKNPATFYNKKLAVLLYLQDNGKIW